MRTLILGGARSGKSRLAERMAAASDKHVVYVATAEARDDAMRERIARHRERRPREWALVEEPLALADALKVHAAPDRLLLVDCLTLWLSNCLGEARAGCWQDARAALLAALPGLAGDLVLVSNEVGQGIVPLGELTRRFVDEAGWLHQELAAHCDNVTLVAAGLPLQLKGACAV